MLIAIIIIVLNSFNLTSPVKFSPSRTQKISFSKNILRGVIGRVVGAREGGRGEVSLVAREIERNFVWNVSTEHEWRFPCALPIDTDIHHSSNGFGDRSSLIVLSSRLLAILKRKPYREKEGYGWKLRERQFFLSCLLSCFFFLFLFFVCRQRDFTSPEKETENTEDGRQICVYVIPWKIGKNLIGFLPLFRLLFVERREKKGRNMDDRRSMHAIFSKFKSLNYINLNIRKIENNDLL